MPQLLQPFDARQYDPSQGAGQLPLGKHPVIIETSEIKPNKNNDGGYVEFGLRITDGPDAGKTGAYRLNLYHSNPKTVEIAHRQMSALCHVTGVYNVTDTNMLHNIPFIVEVTNQKLTSEQEDEKKNGGNPTPYTQVSKVFDRAGNEPGKQGQSAPAAQPMQQQPMQQAPQPPAQQPQGQWGGAQQQPQQPPQQQQPQWGQQASAQQPAAPQGNAPAWGQQQPPAQAPAQQPGQGWQQQAPAAGPAPWGQR